MESQPSSSSSSSPSTSFCTVTAMTSESLTNPSLLQEPKHKRARVVCAVRRERTWERRRRPRLKTRSTSTEVAVDPSLCEMKTIEQMRKQTWDRKIVAGHSRKAWICRSPFIPPHQCVVDMFRISAEVGVQFITKL